MGWQIRVAALLGVIVLSAGSRAVAQQNPPGPTAGGPGGGAVSAAAEPPVAGGVAPAATPAPPATGPAPAVGLPQLPDLTKPENFSSALQLVVLMTVLSLAPAILLMMTSFTRIVIVLSLLRQALGTQQLPPNQVLIGLAMFMTFIVMGPTWKRVNDTALKPYMDGTITQPQALENAQIPVRDFMIRQIVKQKNETDVDLFAKFSNEPEPTSWDDVKTTTLIPAFMLSELKAAFTLGFKVYLPFLVIDIVISTVLISMGMMMLPPAMISLPFKLLLFVLVNGWHLITAGLMDSFVNGS